MSDAQFERTMRFSATHRYRRAEWSETRNREAFGDLVDAHPHDWVVTAVTRGSMAAVTGFSVDLPRLERAMESLISPLRDSDLNQSIPAVREGRMLPSCESLARWFFDELEPHVPAPARLVRVRVAESPEVAATWPTEGA